MQKSHKKKAGKMQKLLFYLDVGLLSHKLFNDNQISIVNENTSINYGAIYEACVAQ